MSLREFLMSITWPFFMTTFGNRFRNWSALTFLPGVTLKSERWDKVSTGSTLVRIIVMFSSLSHQETWAWRWTSRFFCHKPAQKKKEAAELPVCCTPSFTKSTNLKRDAVRESALKFGWKITIHQVLYELLQMRMKVWSSGEEQRRGLFLRRAHLCAVVLVRPERAIEQDDPIPVEAQPDRLLCGQLGPFSCQPHDTLSFASNHIQFLYPLQHQVKVHPKAGCRSVCDGAKPELACFSTDNNSLFIESAE